MLPSLSSVYLELFGNVVPVIIRFQGIIRIDGFHNEISTKYAPPFVHYVIMYPIREK